MAVTDEQWAEALDKVGKHLQSPAFTAAMQDADRIIAEGETSE